MSFEVMALLFVVFFLFTLVLLLWGVLPAVIQLAIGSCPGFRKAVMRM